MIDPITTTPKKGGLCRRLLFLTATGFLLGIAAAHESTKWIFVASAGACVSFLLVYVAQRGVRFFTIPMFFLTFYVIETYVGGLIWFFAKQKNEAFFWAVNLAMPLFGLGMCLANIVLQFNPRRAFTQFCHSPVRDGLKGTGFRLTLVGLGSFCVLVGIFQMLRVGQIPLLSLLLRGDRGATAQVLSRFEFTSMRGTEYLKQFYEIVLPLVSLIALGKYRLHRTKRWKYVAGIFTLMSAFFLLSSGQKAPIIMLGAALFLFDQFYSARLNLRLGIFLVAMGLLIVIGLTVLKYRGQGIGAAVGGVLQRMVIVPIEWNLFPIFERFPWHYSFGSGRYLWSDIVSLRPGPDISFSAWWYNELFPTSIIQGSANCIFIGQTYADFGLWGPFAGMFAAGFALQSIQIHFFRRSRTVIGAAFFALLSTTLVTLAHATIVSSLFSHGVIAAVSTILLIRGVSAFLSLRQISLRHSEVG